MFSDWVYFIRTNSLPICGEGEGEGEENMPEELEEELNKDEDFGNMDDTFELSIDEVIKKSQRR